MTDIKTPEQRSKNMSAVRSSNTEIELRLRSALWHSGYRYRVKNTLPGKPDIVFTKKKVVIFCDGCFWHGCPQCYSLPESNKNFWLKKINNNRNRDKKVTQILTNEGWIVLRFWGCEIKRDISRVVSKIEEVFTSELCRKPNNAVEET